MDKISIINLNLFITIDLYLSKVGALYKNMFIVLN